MKTQHEVVEDFISGVEILIEPPSPPMPDGVAPVVSMLLTTIGILNLRITKLEQRINELTGEA